MSADWFEPAPSLSCQGSNLDSSDPESDVLPITPQDTATAGHKDRLFSSLASCVGVGRLGILADAGGCCCVLLGLLGDGNVLRYKALVGSKALAMLHDAVCGDALKSFL